MSHCYVYKWTHMPTLKWYVGSRTAKNSHPNDGYICSSLTVKPMIKNAPTQWQREIVAVGDRDAMLALELEILETVDAIHDPRSFNRCVGVPRGIAGVPKTEEHKQKLRQHNLGKKHKESSVAIMRAKRAKQIIQITEGTKIKMALAKQGIPKMKTTCPHCGKTGGHPAMTRWHFNKCQALVSANPNANTIKEVYRP